MTQSRVLDVMSVQQKLPPDLRAVFDALYLDGLSESGACARLAIPASELQSRRSTILKSLRAPMN